MTSVFISKTLDGLTSFSRIKNLRKTCDDSITVKDLGGISIHEMAENWQLLKDTLALPNISLVVGLSSVNILLALRAREISISRLTICWATNHC